MKRSITLTRGIFLVKRLTAAQRRFTRALTVRVIEPLQLVLAFSYFQAISSGDSSWRLKAFPDYFLAKGNGKPPHSSSASNDDLGNQRKEVRLFFGCVNLEFIGFVDCRNLILDLARIVIQCNFAAWIALYRI